MCVCERERFKFIFYFSGFLYYRFHVENFNVFFYLPLSPIVAVVVVRRVTKTTPPPAGGEKYRHSGRGGGGVQWGRGTLHIPSTLHLHHHHLLQPLPQCTRRAARATRTPGQPWPRETHFKTRHVAWSCKKPLPEKKTSRKDWQDCTFSTNRSFLLLLQRILHQGQQSGRGTMEKQEDTRGRT